MAKTKELPATPESTPESLGSVLRVGPGRVDLASADDRSTPGFTGDKQTCATAFAALGPELADLQERLYAHGRVGGTRALLLVLQGMDTSGKGGTISHVLGQVDPQGVSVAGFKKPTEEEAAHDFLWRIRRRLPDPGLIGAFDRSHYEAVLIERVRELVPRDVWEPRYEQINAFESELVAAGTTVVKVFLHIDPDTQRERLQTRLDNPAKHWKFNPGDLDERLLWSSYQEAYATLLQRCSPDDAPWHIVPAGRKWYRDWAVATLLRDALADMKLDWPDPGLDVPALSKRLRTEQPT